tara:strand:- start:4184 stop:4378 length:195 start_codon:yes stop_codon:yes gene_type:complete
MSLNAKILQVLGDERLTVDEIYSFLKDDHEKYEINSRMAVLVRQKKVGKEYSPTQPKPFYFAFK